MHLGIFSVALLFSSVFALPVEKQLLEQDVSPDTTKQLATRDTSVIERAHKALTSDLNMIKSTIRGLPSGGSESIANMHSRRLLDQYVQLNNDIRDGAYNIRKGPSVGQVETLMLSTTIGAFTTLISEVTTGMTSENTKRMIWTAGQRAAQDRFAQELATSSAAVTMYGDAIISRLPVIDQLVANTFKSAFLNLVEPGVRVSLPSTENPRTATDLN
jgi:hypothetical protein